MIILYSKWANLLDYKEKIHCNIIVKNIYNIVVLKIIKTASSFSLTTSLCSFAVTGVTRVSSHSAPTHRHFGPPRIAC